MTHDLALHSGERQTAALYENNRPDHRYRYEWAASFIPQGTFGLDAFCGNGYGSWLLGHDRHVLALDGSPEAVLFAGEHYSGPRIRFAHAYWPFELPPLAFDFIVSLESIEHVPDGDYLFSAFCRSLKPGGVLVYSTPNEDALPHASTGNHFHHKHYTLEECLDLVHENGLVLIDWAGQNTYTILPNGLQGALLRETEMVLRARVPGQFSIVACRKPELEVRPAGLRARLRQTFVPSSKGSRLLLPWTPYFGKKLRLERK